MILLFVYSLAAACMVALVTFLQTEAAWWKGPLAAVAVYAVAIGALFFVSQETLDRLAHLPIMGLIIAAQICAVLILVGSVTALIGRRFAAPGQVAGFAFVGSWVLFFGMMVSNAFT